MCRPLFALPVLASLLALGACTKLTEPVDNHTSGERPQPAQTVARPVPPSPAPEAPAEGQPEPTVGASHILVAYQGAMRSRADRTKEDAKKRADELLARAKKGENFGQLAVENSDDPSAKMNQGSLGEFPRSRMVKPFADAAFALQPGQISDLVETPFGYHIIKRDK